MEAITTKLQVLDVQDEKTATVRIKVPIRSFHICYDNGMCIDYTVLNSVRCFIFSFVLSNVSQEPPAKSNTISHVRIHYCAKKSLLFFFFFSYFQSFTLSQDVPAKNNTISHVSLHSLFPMHCSFSI